LNLTQNGCLQQDLFDTADRTRPSKAMQVMDKINQQMGIRVTVTMNRRPIHLYLVNFIGVITYKN
jgi:hypothetical protein